jgi:hypothetical protein
LKILKIKGYLNLDYADQGISRILKDRRHLEGKLFGEAA